jgi:anti-sigma factor RsiW
MVCSEINDLIHPYLDGELDLSRSLEVENHMEGCPACSRAYFELKSLRSMISRSSLYHEAPLASRRQLRTELRRASGSRSASRLRQGWRALWAPIGVTVVALLLVFAIITRPTAESMLSDEIVSAHVRSLMPGHLIDIPSSDQHTVKPWFNGRLDFSPQVKDLAQQGFPLIGGRLDYVSDRPVAAVVYQRRKHVINLFIWPVGKAGRTETWTASRQGYHIALWSQDGMMYAAVSDVNETDLDQFARLIRVPG